MFRRPLVLSPRRSPGFLAAWENYDPKAASPLLDYALRALLPPQAFDARSLSYASANTAYRRRPNSRLDHAIAIAMFGLLGVSGLVIGWALLVP